MKQSLAWSPSGELVANIAPDRTLQVGPSTGEDPHLLFGGGWAATFHPAGDRLLTCWGLLRIWPVRGRPFHTLPKDELLARLRSMTNCRVVPEETNLAGYRLEVGPFPGWESVPLWCCTGT